MLLNVMRVVIFILLTFLDRHPLWIVPDAAGLKDTNTA
jgi:hypothetical protein